MVTLLGNYIHWCVEISNLHIPNYTACKAHSMQSTQHAKHTACNGHNMQSTQHAQQLARPGTVHYEHIVTSSGAWTNYK